jgi:hypothetical protein
MVPDTEPPAWKSLLVTRALKLSWVDIGDGLGVGDGVGVGDGLGVGVAVAVGVTLGVWNPSQGKPQAATDTSSTATAAPRERGRTQEDDDISTSLRNDYEAALSSR